MFAILKKYRRWIGRLLGLISPNILNVLLQYKAKREHACINRILDRRLKLIKKTGLVKVVFYANNLEMWRYQPLVEELIKDVRFHVSVLILPFPQFTDAENKDKASVLSAYLKSKKINFVDGNSEDFCTDVWWKEVNPDLIFVCQPYQNMYKNDMDWDKHRERLYGYYPYGTPTFKEEFTYNLLFHNSAWRFYCPDRFFYEMAMRNMHNHGKNLILSGDLRLGEFNKITNKSVWKNDPQRKRKRIIFAPHFTIMGNGLLYRGGFLEVAEIMREMVVKYQEDVEFAFKPHPRLKSELVLHPAWGSEKAEMYYKFWMEQSNSMYFEGEYVDLFKESDAMIHNSGSFTAEYLRTGNPVMFVSSNIDFDKAQMNELGLMCFDNHYVGITKEDIECFIKNVVIDENDPKKEIRKQFSDNYLNVRYGASPETIIYNDLRVSLFDDNLDN